MADHQVSAVPVMEDDTLVGIITQTDLFHMAVDAMGTRRSGVRVTLLIPEIRCMLADVINAITNAGGFFVSLITVATSDPSTDRVAMKIQDMTQAEVEDELSDLSVEVLDVRST